MAESRFQIKQNTKTIVDVSVSQKKNMGFRTPGSTLPHTIEEHTRNENEDHHSKRGCGNMTLIITTTKATNMKVLLSLHKVATT